MALTAEMQKIRAALEKVGTMSVLHDYDAATKRACARALTLIDGTEAQSALSPAAQPEGLQTTAEERTEWCDVARWPPDAQGVIAALCRDIDLLLAERDAALSAQRRIEAEAVRLRGLLEPFSKLGLGIAVKFNLADEVLRARSALAAEGGET